MTPGDLVYVAYQTDPDPWRVTGRIGDQVTVTRLCDGMQSTFATYDLHLFQETPCEPQP